MTFSNVSTSDVFESGHVVNDIHQDACTLNEHRAGETITIMTLDTSSYFAK